MLPNEQIVLQNEEKSRRLAQILFPHEEWRKTEDNIFVAQGRLIEQQKEPLKWEKEMSQARILTRRGSVAFFLPELEMGEQERLCADLILNGVVTEMKTITGNRETLGSKFKYGYRQGASLIKYHPEITEHSVFIRLLSDLTVDGVRAKVTGELKNRKDDGNFICFFETSERLYTWSYAELREMIGKK